MVEWTTVEFQQLHLTQDTKDLIYEVDLICMDDWSHITMPGLCSNSVKGGTDMGQFNSTKVTSNIDDESVA